MISVPADPDHRKYKARADHLALMGATLCLFYCSPTIFDIETFDFVLTVRYVCLICFL